MQLSGRTVRFWLSQVGRQEDSAWGSWGGKEIEALVVDEDQLGVWLWLPDKTDVFLLRWAHISTAALEYIPPAPVERTQAGFRP